MNERIKTLAKVAGYDEINKAAMKLTGFDPEKFAELIVRERSRHDQTTFWNESQRNHNCYA